ncbi:hypothetical protein BpHYR1_022729 [Brachionus plicatilis]|uniref:Uncharacterized protein n=1 Tax=Brachionus plicatilis TaxID=10195 RepID=A0A3M7R5A5_BRAPC|nr:hypothetical protein BpHYR1_022729 [Brachionus plicatilis]
MQKEEISQKKALFNNFKTYYMARGMIFNGVRVSSEHYSFRQRSFTCFKAAFGDLAIKFLNDTKLSEPPNARVDNSRVCSSPKSKCQKKKQRHRKIELSPLRSFESNETQHLVKDEEVFQSRDSDQVHVEINLANYSAAPSVEKSLSASFDDECPNEKHDENCAVRHSTGFIYDRLEGSERDAFLKRIFGKIRNQKKLLEYTVEDIYGN